MPHHSALIELMLPRLSPLFALLVLAILVSLTFKTNLLTSTFLFFGTPALYLTLTLKNKRIIPRLLIAAILGSSALAVLIDYLGFINQSWYVVDTVFPFRLFNLIPVEDIIWGFSWIYLILVYFESTNRTGNKSLMGKRAKYWLGISGFAILVLLLIQNLTPNLLIVPYYYLTAGLILALGPAVVFLKYYPGYIFPFLKTALYITPVSFANEITSLKLGYWHFDGGQFLAVSKVLGVSLPLEELFFFILIGSIFVLSYYEFFDGDQT